MALEISGLLARREVQRLLRTSLGPQWHTAGAHNFAQTARGGHAPVRDAVTFYPHQGQPMRSYFRRLAELMQLPLANVSGDARLLAYPAGGYYLPHYDSLLRRHLRKVPEGRSREGLGLPYNPRLATVLVTLEEAIRGGEFVFPYTERLCGRARSLGAETLSPREAERDVAHGVDPADPDPVRRVEAAWHEYFTLWTPFADNCSLFRSQQIKTAVIRPAAGSGVIFFNHLFPEDQSRRSQVGRRRRVGDLDPCSLHMGCRVHDGHKVVLATWLHVEP